MVFVFDLMIFVVNFAFVIVCIVWFDVWLLALCGWAFYVVTYYTYFKS